MDEHCNEAGHAAVETASDGAQAVLKYKSMPIKPDIITMDLTMPNMDGLGAISHIMKENPQQRIVVVSAMGYEEAMVEDI